jgi:anhydro-N-acetylmuramic acid kinase
MPVLNAIGLMSGTSLDGVDIAFLRSDGESILEAGSHSLMRYSKEERELFRRAIDDAQHVVMRTDRVGSMREAEIILTQIHARAVHNFCTSHNIDLSGIDVIGFHGQTVLHRPEKRLTVQIGDAPLLHAALKRPIVYDFRAADINAGGQGAPLVPIYHQALIHAADHPALSKKHESIACLNIGGVANITVLTQSGELMASDVGPGNALIDDFVMRRRGLAYDENGALAAQGHVAQDMLAYWLAHPFFGAPAPKSLDRNHFATQHSQSLSDADGAATLTAFTAGAIAQFAAHMPHQPDVWIICGGGAHNNTLMKMIRDGVQKPLYKASDFGWSVDAMEAQAFAYLAVRSLRALPLTFPKTTGVPQPMTGGVLYAG